MPRESCKGTKELLSVLIDKRVVRKVEEQARKNHRTKSGQVEYLLEKSLERKLNDT
jgi:hypothetical protein